MTEWEDFSVAALLQKDAVFLQADYKISPLVLIPQPVYDAREKRIQLTDGTPVLPGFPHIKHRADLSSPE